MNPLTLMAKYYPPDTPTHRLLVRHSTKVAKKATAVALRLGPSQVDISFVEEAALLHDIGIFATSAPDIGCLGDLPYLAHGIKGREILEAEGLPRHALVCERHIGVGLTAAEIRRQRLPLPQRDMIPLTLEEQIIAYADLFFSKSPAENGRERSPETVRRSLARFGPEKVEIFDAWHDRFSA